MKNYCTFLVLAISVALVTLFTGCHGYGGSDGPGEYEMQLLRTFQPILVQKLAADYDALPYPVESDLIGRLSLHAGDEDNAYTVQVDTAVPVMYADVHVAQIQTSHHHQLVYAFFYPERPISTYIWEDFFAYLNQYFWSGLIDGKVIRITLDAADEDPLFVEVVRNCGCSWQFYVNKMVDDAAREEFEAKGQAYPGLVKTTAPHDTQYVWIMPGDVDEEEKRVVVVAEEGWCASPHHTMGAFTGYEQWLSSDLPVTDGTIYIPENYRGSLTYPASLRVDTYSLLAYGQLHELGPDGSDENVGIFDHFDYIWNSYSPYTMFLRDRGLATKFPGTPKDKDHIEVVHETMDFWDTYLYERFIHLPESLFGSNGPTYVSAH